MQVVMKILCIVYEEIDHQQKEGDDKEQEESDDQFYHDGKPHGLMVKSRFQKENENGKTYREENARARWSDDHQAGIELRFIERE